MIRGTVEAHPLVQDGGQARAAAGVVQNVLVESVAPQLQAGFRSLDKEVFLVRGILWIEQGTVQREVLSAPNVEEYGGLAAVIGVLLGLKSGRNLHANSKRFCRFNTNTTHPNELNFRPLVEVAGRRVVVPAPPPGKLFHEGLVGGVTRRGGRGRGGVHGRGVGHDTMPSP